MQIEDGLDDVVVLDFLALRAGIGQSLVASEQIVGQIDLIPTLLV